MKKVKVIVDAGKFNTKAIAEKDGVVSRAMFRTKVMPTQEIAIKSKDSYVVEIDGLDDPMLSRAVIGKAAPDRTVDYDKEKKKDVHKIAIYTAISNLVSNGDVIENLVVGYPVTLFKNVKARNSFAEYIKGSGEIKVMVNGIPVSFTIEKVTVLPESSGVVLKDFSNIKKSTVGVLDFGGLNVNACIFQNGEILEDAYFTINKGVNIYKNTLKDALNVEFGTNIQDYLMDDILAAGMIKKDPENSKLFIEKFTSEYLEEVKHEAVRYQWDFGTLPRILGTGGGSTQFGQALQNIFPDIEVKENSVWDNAEGWAKFAGIFLV